MVVADRRTPRRADPGAAGRARRSVGPLTVPGRSESQTRVPQGPTLTAKGLTRAAAPRPARAATPLRRRGSERCPGCASPAAHPLVGDRKSASSSSAAAPNIVAGLPPPRGVAVALSSSSTRPPAAAGRAGSRKAEAGPRGGGARSARRGRGGRAELAGARGSSGLVAVAR